VIVATEMLVVFIEVSQRQLSRSGSVIEVEGLSAHALDGGIML
jgi:hypothetical protein